MKIGPPAISNRDRYRQDSPTGATIGPPAIGNRDRYLRGNGGHYLHGNGGRYLQNQHPPTVLVQGRRLVIAGEGNGGGVSNFY
jgi:hypothetical protein